MIQSIFALKVILKMMVLKIIYYINQYKDISKELMVLMMIITEITFIIGNLKDSLMKKINSFRTSDTNYYDTSKIRVKFNGGCLKQHRPTVLHGEIVNVYIVYEVTNNFNVSSYLILEIVYLELLN